MTNREIMEKWFQRMWHEEDRAAIEEMAPPSLVARGLGLHDRVGQEGFRVFADLLLARITEMQLTIDTLVDDGAWGQCLITIRAKCRSSGKPVAFTGQVRAHFVDGRIQEAYNAIDFISLFEQLGQLPQDTLGRLLSGERVGLPA